MSDISLTDVLGDTLAFVVGVICGVTADAEWLMLTMIVVSTMAIFIRKSYHEQFSDYWDYMFLVTMPLGMCIGRILWLYGVI